MSSTITKNRVRTGQIPNGEQVHLHYYRAVKGGQTGRKPLDPLSINLIPRTIYLTWPYQLPRDVIPTFSVNLVYSPPVPGAAWVGNTFYPAGSVVTSAANRGHYYTALTGGFSTSEPKEPKFPVDVRPTFNNGSLVLLDSGTSQPIFRQLLLRRRILERTLVVRRYARASGRVHRPR